MPAGGRAMGRTLRLLVAGVAAALAATLVTMALYGPLQGPGIDSLYLLRELIYGPEPAPAGTPVVVVGIDEETYRRAPFAGTPQALWAPKVGAVVTALHQGGAKVIGVDLIQPTSVETLIPGFERDYLLALRGAARAGALVLAKVQHQQEPLLPYRGHAIAVGGAANIRSVNLVEDPDGVLRRVPLTLDVTGPDGKPRPEAAFAIEIAARALGTPLERGADGRVSIGGYAIPGSNGDTLLVNHPTAAGAIPTYSLGDLLACAEAGNADYFQKNFAGKVVLVGTVLDVEDRKLSSNRWVTKPEGLGLPDRCTLPVMSDLYRTDLRRDTIPGVFIHAAAIGNVIARNALAEVDRDTAAGLVLLVAAAAAVLTLAAAPLPAGVGLLLVLGAWCGAAVVAFHGGTVLPLLQGVVAAALAFPLLLLFRFAVLDRDQRQIRQAFRLYLPGPLIDEMIASGQSPQLGGENRDVSIMFCDIAGFTKMSEGMDPEKLVSILNRYFTVMTDIIEEHGGFVDKYIGDAVLAVFGAPYRTTNHARAAVDAAIAMARALTEDPTLLAADNGPRGSNRTGIATGVALIGNIGSPRRFNYTVMGDTANLASRLEGANKAYGTALMVSGETMALYGDPGAFRELDTVRVVGRHEPVTVYEPLSPERRADPVDTARRAAYAQALALWRTGRFAEAAEGFAALAPHDKAAAAMERKARRHAAQQQAEPAQSQPTAWAGVTALTEK